MPVDEATRFEQLHDHYKDTFSYIQSSETRRNRLFLTTLGLSCLLVLRALSPDVTGQAIAAVLTKRFDLPMINITVFGSALWIVLLYTIVRYFQAAASIERCYPYLHSLEDLLSIEYTGKAFTREGKAYLDDYPRFSKWVTFLYTILFPVLLLLAVGISIGLDLCREGSSIGPFFNSAVGIMIEVSVVLYLQLVHEQHKKQK